MQNRFSTEFFSGNRERLSELFIGTAPIVMTANGLLQRGGDTTFSFAQDASFWYLTGIEQPDITLVIDRGKEYLIVPGRSGSREAFDGAISNDDLTRVSGIKTIYNEEEGWKNLNGRLRKVKHVATLANPPAYIDSFGFYTNPARAALVEKLKEANKDLDLLDLNPHLVRLRMIKQPQELEAIMAAINITASSFKDAIKPAKLKRYTHEYQLEAEITKGMRTRGADGHAFSPIVASGEHACTLHNVENNGLMAKNDLVVVDIGAEVDHYAADITRTICLGTPSKRQQAIYSAVAEVQQYAFSLLRPGVDIREYETAIEQFMGEKLRELNLIKSISHEKVRAFYPHASSHFMGLNVHDVADYTRALEPGMVLTVEPGIYVTKEKIGVRIEDDVLVTKQGIKILSGKLAKTLELI